MYSEHTVTLIPDDHNASIWRYTDLAKLLDLFGSSSLYFTRADRLGDPFEGSWPAGALLRRRKRYVDSEEVFQSLSEGHIKGTYLSCWHLSQYESAAMWSLYLSKSEGIAIRSSVQRFMDAVQPETERVFLTSVRYIDYDRDDFEPRLQSNTLTPLVYKRRSFEHEKEIRAIVSRGFSSDTPEFGIKVRVDLSRLIEFIYVSPASPRWFYEVVQQATARYSVQASVLHSDLVKSPVH